MSIEQQSIRAEQQSGGSAAGLTVLRARCGRVLAPMHLTEVVETCSQRHHWRAPIVLCGAQDIPDPDYFWDPEPCDPEPDDCLGCADCLRYCPACVDEAARWLARTDQQGQTGIG